MIYLVTRPFVWLIKAVAKLLKLPGQTYKSFRDGRQRKHVKSLMKADKASKRSSV